MNTKNQSKSPTPIGWVDYLDIWAKSKISKTRDLDFLDILQKYSIESPRSRGPVCNKFTPSARASHKV